MNKKHKYYTQINLKMVLTKSDLGYFVVLATKDIFVEEIDRDLTRWSKVSINLKGIFQKLCCESFTWYSTTYILQQI